MLDKHCIELSDINESIQSLYSQIFPKIRLDNENKTGESSSEEEEPLSDKEIVFLLCDWAITTQRYGIQRIFYGIII